MGGGVAGLLAARVLSDFFATVTVVERDTLTGTLAPRKAVPQGRHLHGLLARGRQIIEDLFPGLIRDLAAEGVPFGDYGTDLSWYFNGKMFQKVKTGLVCVGSGRPLLEQRIRDRVSSIANVRVVAGTTITGLLTDASGKRVTGLRIDRVVEAGGSSAVEADLFVDALGRGSRLAAWLADLGFPSVERDVVKTGLSYTSLGFHAPLASDPIGDGLGIIVLATPELPRGAVFGRLKDQYAISLTGMFGDRPPREPGPFMDYVKSLHVPEIYRSVKSAEPMGAPTSLHCPASVRLRYERMRYFPAGIVVMGDAFSTFNPVYGQGMTIAAIAALVLQRHLGMYEEVCPSTYMRAVSRAMDTPWSLAARADLGFPAAEGRRTVTTRLSNAYTARLQSRATRDPVLTRSFLRVAGLVDPPSALLRPGIMARTLAP
jgi:2-polyprenyl-6-methoxyphenol hydroxylase and related FAD-dependent oxidoreductases